MNRLFRKYHRWLAIAFAVRLLNQIVTGIGFSIAKSFHQRQWAGFLLHLHTLETFGLEAVFPIINGIGWLGLLIAGLYMTSLLRQRRVLSSNLLYHDYQT
ncbi:peptidase [Microseira wollei]|uniref:Peptidase n=1 Tax=Microseira wollei NIES-4236 TaxID=2530354 RepID=A0AAV3XNV5_9CYAN|nr:peptidase [Microseira wollei]GET44393.1 hypothetical protein MiSe_92200 [Microseira wollei NIES-4236]